LLFGFIPVILPAGSIKAFVARWITDNAELQRRIREEPFNIEFLIYNWKLNHVEKRMDNPIPSPGEAAPEFEIPNESGGLFSLSRTIETGENILLVFYRGHW